jgi:hypothetical protein
MGNADMLDGSFLMIADHFGMVAISDLEATAM